MTRLIKYLCDICGEVYASEAEAVACETRFVPECPFEPGDIVLHARYGRFGWFDGDPTWIAASSCELRHEHRRPCEFVDAADWKRRGGPAGVMLFTPYYYVKAVERGTGKPFAHTLNVKIATLAMRGPYRHDQIVIGDTKLFGINGFVKAAPEIADAFRSRYGSLKTIFENS